MKNLLFLLLPVTIVSVSQAQKPASPMIVVQAANVAPVAPAPKTTASEASPVQAAIKSLEKAKAANAEILKKQEATLQQLDEVQKAAEQLKIFAKRG